MSNILFDVTLAHRIKQALIRNRINDLIDLNWLATGDNIMKVRQIRLGFAKIVVADHVVDFDSELLLPLGIRVAPLSDQLPDRLSGDFVWSRGGLMALIEQASTQGGKWMPGRRALVVQLLYYMIDHPDLIPVELVGRRIFFWGTILLDKENYPFINTLDWNGSEPYIVPFFIDKGLEAYKATGPSFV